jgi:hypothetical protein
MSAGNIDDILARIQRLESATSDSGARSHEPAAEPHDGDNEHAHEDAAAHDEATAHEEASEHEDGYDSADILTPETYNESSEDDALITIEPEDADSPNDLFASDDAAEETDAITAIEPDDGSADDAMMSIEPEPDESAMAEIGPDDAMAEITPEPIDASDFDEPRDAEADDDANDDEDADQAWVIGRHGLRPRGDRDTAPEPSEASHEGDGVISVNPGGAGSAGMSDLFAPDSKSLGHVQRSLADALADAGISREQISAAERVAASTPGKDVSMVLVEQGADEIAIQSAVARHHGLPFERIDQAAGLDGGIDGGLIQRLGLPFCAEHRLLPLRMDGKRPVIASTKPDIAFELDEIRRRLKCATPKVVLATPEDITGALEIAGYGSEERAEQDQVDLNAILEEVDENDVTVEKREDQTVDLEQKAGESPVIRYVNYIIQTAVKEGASDIHIEPAEKKITVRLRIDGVLYESMNPPANMSAAITSRIKIMANLDISERRIPQDGRIRATVQGRKLDLRVSTLPVRLRREGRHAYPRHQVDQRAARGPRLRREHARDLEAPGQAAPRHRARHRPHRLG